jgi:hypothetical protein
MTIITKTDFSFCNLRHADYSYKNLIGFNFRNADLTLAQLRSANLSKADFTQACLEDATLASANLSNANLTDAKLKDVLLEDAYLANAILVNADLTNADLENTNLTSADLRGANLSGSCLAGSDLTGTKLEGAIGLGSKEGEIAFASWLLDLIQSGKGKLDMKIWHSPCGTIHCIAGWACPDEKHPAATASRLYPTLARFFNNMNYGKAIEALELVASGRLSVFPD